LESQQAVEHDPTDLTELAQLAEGWLEWGRLPDAWFSILHAEILCRRLTVSRCSARFAPKWIFK
jgi:hypothetical protein